VTVATNQIRVFGMLDTCIFISPYSVARLPRLTRGP
jgi:hypothetical protein